MTSKKVLINGVLAIIVPLIFVGLSSLPNPKDIKIFLTNVGLFFFAFMLIFRVTAPIFITSYYILSKDPHARVRLESSGIKRFFIIDDTKV